MILKYASYTHANNECEVVIAREPMRNNRGVIVAWVERWDVRGFLQAATQAAVTTALVALEAAYAVDGGNLVLYLNDGTTESAHKITSASTIGGTRVTRPISYPQGRGAEYTTWRSYDLTVEGVLPIASGTTILSYQAGIQRAGGGPRFVYLQTLTGLPQYQQTAQSTPYRLVQTGGSRGYTTYPTADSPLYPANEHQDQRQVSQSTGGDGQFTTYETTWQYVFESASPL